MPCRAITFGQAPHAAQRVRSQLATMASLTFKAGSRRSVRSIARKAVLTDRLQAFRAGSLTTTRNITYTRRYARPTLVAGSSELPPSFAVRVCRMEHLQTAGVHTRQLRELSRVFTSSWGAQFGLAG